MRAVAFGSRHGLNETIAPPSAVRRIGAPSIALPCTHISAGAASVRKPPHVSFPADTRPRGRTSGHTNSRVAFPAKLYTQSGEDRRAARTTTPPVRLELQDMGCYQFERVMSQRNSSASAPPSNAAHASAASAVVASLQMIGNSPAFRSILREISRIAGAAAPVLIEGETGSGKEVAARAVHYLGTRREWPFIPINCGAIPDNLAEAELFGHERGAFTDARQARRGLVAEADGGTLFLDEVDALSPKAQVTLLRFLQDQRYRPLGRGTELRSDVRIIA